MSIRGVIFSNHGLSGRAGTECFLWDVTRRMTRKGIRCGIFSPRVGPFAEEFKEAGISVWSNPEDIDWEPDILHCHHVAESVLLLNRFPRTRALFMLHEPRLWQGFAPITPLINRYIAVDQLCRKRLANDLGRSMEGIDVIPNGFDPERFLPRPPLPEKPERALVFSSGATHHRHVILARNVCASLGIRLDVIAPGFSGVTDRPEDLLPCYDLVFAKARCALEALSVGCAVVLLGAEGVGPMVTLSRFEHARALNFGMGLLEAPLDSESLLREVNCYDPVESAYVSQKVRQECSLEKIVEKLMALYEELFLADHSKAFGQPMVSLSTAAWISQEIINENKRLEKMLSESINENKRLEKMLSESIQNSKKMTLCEQISQFRWIYEIRNVLRSRHAAPSETNLP